MSSRASEWQQGKGQGGAAVEPSLPSSARRIWQLWQTLGSIALRLWARIEVRRATQRRRSLRVLETVAMGDKRFVAIVQVKEARFLIGGGSAGVSLLARLDAEQEFASVLDERAATAPASIPAPAAIAVPGSIATQRSNEVAW